METYPLDSPAGTLELDLVRDAPTETGAILYYIDAEGTKQLRIKFANGVDKWLADDTTPM